MYNKFNSFRFLCLILMMTYSINLNDKIMLILSVLCAIGCEYFLFKKVFGNICVVLMV